MATVRTFCCIILLVAFGCSGVFGSGIIGKRGEWARYFKLKKEKDYERIVEIARKEIGVREAGLANSGQRVAVYLDCVGVKFRAPWCAALVSFVFKEAGYAQPRTPWSPALFPASRVVRQASPGYVFGLYYTSLGRIGHCGIVTGLQGDNLYTVEGNTSLPGSREGDGVYARVRHRRTVSRYADWVR